MHCIIKLEDYTKMSDEGLRKEIGEFLNEIMEFEF